MSTAVRLSTSLEALAALSAHVRVETEGIDVDDRVRDLLDRVAREVLGPDVAAMESGAAVVGMGRAFLRQAIDLVEHPGRAGGWDEVDEPLLQGMGRLSGAITEAFRVAEDRLDGFGDRLRADGAAFLDIGTGTAWLAIAMARTFPALRVVGIDLFEPALALARRNVAAEGLEARVELRGQDGTLLDEADTYDAVWLPLPFLRAEAMTDLLRSSGRALRPGGWVVAGSFAGPDDELSKLLIELRTVRSGGHPWEADELLAVMTANGFTETQEVPRTWAAPVRLYAGRHR